MVHQGMVLGRSLLRGSCLILYFSKPQSVGLMKRLGRRSSTIGQTVTPMKSKKMARLIDSSQSQPSNAVAKDGTKFAS